MFVGSHFYYLLRNFCVFPSLLSVLVTSKWVSVVGGVNQSFRCIIREFYSLCAGRMLAGRWKWYMAQSRNIFCPFDFSMNLKVFKVDKIICMLCHLMQWTCPNLTLCLNFMPSNCWALSVMKCVSHWCCYTFRNFFLNLYVMRFVNAALELCMCLDYTGLFEMIVGVVTTFHTQYTWDRSICVFLFNRTTLQIFVTYLTGALYVLPSWFCKHQHTSQHPRQSFRITLY